MGEILGFDSYRCIPLGSGCGPEGRRGSHWTPGGPRGWGNAGAGTGRRGATGGESNTMMQDDQ